MNILQIETTIARLDAALRAIAERPVDITNPKWVDRAKTAQPLAEAGIKAEAEGLLKLILSEYASGDEPTRIAIRQLLDRHNSFRWASAWAGAFAATPVTAEGFRLQLLNLSVRDQATDARGEILMFRYVCAQAKKHGVDIVPILKEVAALSSDVNKYGMGSVRAWMVGEK